jgi:hypothetical protein
MRIFHCGTVIDYLVDKRGWIIIFWTSPINIPIINTYMDCSLFLCDGNNIGNPISQRYRINKTCFKKFFNFGFNSNDFSWMNRMKLFRTGLASGYVLIL